MTKKSLADSLRSTNKRNRADWKSTCLAIFNLPTGQFPLVLPDVHRIAVFFILRRLKRLGYSNCRVDCTSEGLIVYAHH